MSDSAGRRRSESRAPRCSRGQRTQRSRARRPPHRAPSAASAQHGRAKSCRCRASLRERSGSARCLHDRIDRRRGGDAEVSPHARPPSGRRRGDGPCRRARCPALRRAHPRPAGDLDGRATRGSRHPAPPHRRTPFPRSRDSPCPGRRFAGGKHVLGVARGHDGERDGVQEPARRSAATRTRARPTGAVHHRRRNGAAKSDPRSVRRCRAGPALPRPQDAQRPGASSRGDASTGEEGDRRRVRPCQCRSREASSRTARGPARSYAPRSGCLTAQGSTRR